ncbi:MAG: hypothetical protein RLZZ507_1775 [Cyanobacteriota bacterium]|jgi:hypothetical protein
MFNFKSQLLGIAAVLPVAAVVSFAGSAQAASLSGSLTINGNVVRSDNGGVTKLDFRDIDDIETTGDFSNFIFDFTGTGPDATLPVASPNYINILDLYLTSTGFSPSVDPLVSFLDFGQRTLNGEVGFLTFDLNEPSSVSIGTNFVGFDATGVWQFNGQTIATGGISMSNSRGTQSYTISLDAVRAVPEPTTMLGLGLAAAGMTVARRRKLVKA